MVHIKKKEGGGWLGTSGLKELRSQLPGGILDFFFLTLVYPSLSTRDTHKS